MCTGLEIAFIAGTAMQVIGTLQQGDAAADDAEAAAGVKRQQALAIRQKAKVDERRARRDSTRLAGTQVGRLAASGVQPDTGTGLQLQQELAAEAEFEALVIRAQGGRDAQIAELEARALRKSGKNAQTGSFLSAGGTALSGISSFGGLG